MIAEKALLGTYLKHNYLLKDTSIKPDLLEDTRHQVLLKSMLNLIGKGKPVDVVTLSTVPHIQELGGISYINELASFANEEKIEEYESLILESWKEREKNNILTKAIHEGWEIGKVITLLDEINEAKMDDHASITDILADMYEAPWRPEEVKRGVPTGISQFDRMTNGFQNGEVTVIAARPSMGKTDVMIHFAKQAGWQGCLPIVFSLEMPNKSITDRLIASTGRFNRMKMRNLHKGLTEGQKKLWSQIIGKVSNTPYANFRWSRSNDCGYESKN